jgi:hypothetical protein
VCGAVSELEPIVLNICRRNFRWLTLALLLAWSFGPRAQAQTEQGNKKVLTLQEAVDFALKHYPAVRAALERSTAAQAGVGLARTAYLPRADTVWQTNRATDNNITGLLLPQSITAPISGPVPAPTSGRSAWGSAAGLLFSTAHPAAEVEHACVAEAQAQVHALDRAYYPKIYLQSSVYGRGSGVDPAGNFLGGSNGLGPNRGNWAAGVSVGQLVPTSAVTNDQQRTFVERVRNGKVEWVDVVTGLSVSGNIEIFGDVQTGDEVIRNATDAICPGQQVKTGAAHS